MKKNILITLLAALLLSSCGEYNKLLKSTEAGFNHSKYPWLEWDDNSKVGKLLHVPERADIPENIKEHLIVELYSK